MAEKRVIEYEAASELANDDWLLIDGVTEGTRKIRNTVLKDIMQDGTVMDVEVNGTSVVTDGTASVTVPTDLADLQDDSTHRVVTDTEKSTWSGKQDALTFDDVPTEDSDNPVKSGGIYEAIEAGGKVKDVKVDGTSVVDTNKVAQIDLTGMQDDIDSKQADTKIGGASILDNNKEANLDFLTSYGEASGSIASFNDGAAMPLKSLKVGIEAVQSGTGDPSPTNIRPITGWSAVNVTRTGKNWCPNLIYQRNAKNFNMGTNDDGFPFALKGGVTYTFKCNIDVAGSYTTYVRAESQSTATSYQGPKATFTPTKDEMYKIVVNSLADISSSDFSEVQLELGDTPTTYEAFSGTTYTTQLKDGQGNPLTCYGGELSNENGVQTLVNMKVIVDMGDLNWTYGNGFFRTTDLNATIKRPANNNAKANVISSMYTVETWNAITNTDNGKLALSAGTADPLLVCNTSYTDATAFKTAMAGQKIVYELATPQTIPQDNLAIASQSGTNNLWADSGDILECKYVRDNSAVINDLIARVTALENE